MKSTFALLPALVALLCVFSSPVSADDLLSNLPDDIPVADFMDHQNTMTVGDELMVDFHAPGETMDGVSKWIIANMTAMDWNLNTDTGSHMSRVLVFDKGGRRVGVMVADFIMTPAMQRVDDVKGVQYQISGDDDSGNPGASSSTADETAGANR